jgi:hypothetical protein
MTATATASATVATFENVSVDLSAYTVSLDGVVVFTCPPDWTPYAQIVEELCEMQEDGKISRAARRAMIEFVNNSEIGIAYARTKRWQGFRH